MIRDENMVQAANSMLHNGRNRSMEGQEHEGNANIWQQLQMLLGRTHNHRVLPLWTGLLYVKRRGRGPSTMELPAYTS